MDYFLDASNARRLLDAARAEPRPETLLVSLDLGLSQGPVEWAGDCWRAGGEEIQLEPLEAIAGANRRLFRKPAGGDWRLLESAEQGYAQLVGTSGAPTIELDGIQMHRTSGVDPFEAAGQTVRSVLRPGDRVLDTCGGLGYSAIQAARQGASTVLSYEVHPGVLALRALNPWSRLEAGLPIRLTAGDVFAAVARMEPESMECVVHDPPRYSRAPDLYSEAFYLRLHEVLAPRGRIFHYTGSPYSRGRGRDFHRGVADRLRRAGFSIEPREELQGFVGTRERRRSPSASRWP